MMYLDKKQNYWVNEPRMDKGKRGLTRNVNEVPCHRYYVDYSDRSSLLCQSFLFRTEGNDVLLISHRLVCM